MDSSDSINDEKEKDESGSQTVDENDVNQDMSSVNKVKGKHNKFYKITGMVFFLIF